jgi:hypothetical protein
MSVDETDKVDFITIEKHSGDVLLGISDHLDWDENEGEHLLLLQEKLNAYLRFVESGEIYETAPATKGRSIVILIFGKFPLSDQAEKFVELAGGAIKDAGVSLRFKHYPAQ